MCPHVQSTELIGYFRLRTSTIKVLNNSVLVTLARVSISICLARLGASRIIHHGENTDLAGMPQPITKSIPLGTMMRRICLFSFYDQHGIVDDYVTFFLKELGEFVEKIVFYSNGPLSKAAEVALQGLVSEVIVRPNIGFDVMAYKEGLEKIDFDSQEQYDEVLMVNHTCYGPLYPFSELFTAMDARDCDFWGITAHMEMTPNPFTGWGRLPYHLNANFIVVRSALMRSKSFRQYWGNIEAAGGYEAAIQSHESAFTEYFIKLGYRCETYLDCKKYGSHYPAMLDIDEMLLDRNPLLKRRAFFHDPRLMEHFGGDLPRALQILEETSSYDRSLIWRNVVRVAELRNLNTNASLTSVLPDVRLKQIPDGADYGRVAVCVHMFYTEMLDEILDLTDTIPCIYDFIATTGSEAKKSFIENAVRGRSNIGNIIVRVVEQNRGRDMSSLFITCRDLFLEDRYDVVCRLHTKKTPHLSGAQSNLFKRHMFENLMNSQGFTSNVLDMFSANPWIGVAAPPVVNISYGTLGHAWYSNRAKAEELVKMLDLKVPLDPQTPVAVYGGMFWFQPKALRKLFQHPWKWTDFEPEPYPLDGTLGHALERIICYAAQDAGYITQQILSSGLAGRNYAMLEYKLQKISAALPNADFGYHCKMLEEWMQAGYPMDVTSGASLSAPGGMPSVKQAIGQLVLSTKISIKHRFPAIAKSMSPIYRVLTLKGTSRPFDNR
jgi:lipopolysaccharide biosynthesis protein